MTLTEPGVVGKIGLNSSGLGKRSRIPRGGRREEGKGRGEVSKVGAGKKDKEVEKNEADKEEKSCFYIFTLT